MLTKWSTYKNGKDCEKRL